MTSILLFIIVTAFICIALFYIVVHIVKLWTGCDTDCAIQKIRNFINGTPLYHLAEDTMFITELWGCLQSILGESRYDDLKALAKTSYLLFCNYASGLPYIGVTVVYQDDNEKMRIENVIKNLTSMFLRNHNLCDKLLIDWKENPTLKLPLLMIRYAETSEQERILTACLKQENDKVLKRYQPLIDDEEDDISE